MCGISGFNWKDEEAVRQMTAALSHRGPDAEGIFTDEGISLGHDRLAVIDLSPEANQPMYDARRELAIVYNGEIYNFQELRKELEAEYQFQTKSDTEVILAGYRKWGKGVTEKLSGMFSFAIWDKRDRSLFAARDHAGIKPFYYYWDGSRFIFASEIKALLTHDIPRKLDYEAANYFFRILYVPEPKTLIQSINKLPPRGTLFLKNGTLTISSYTVIKTKKEDISYGEATELVHKKVLESVERHLVADVPVGVYLSGGIDSSTVLAAMSQFRKNIKTFSVGFALEQDEQPAKFNRDFELAARTSKFFGAEHHPLVISTNDALVAFEEMSGYNDDPISNPTAIAMMLLAKHARKDVTVALTGNGGDELFGGYDRYRMALAASYFMQLPAFVRLLAARHPKLAKLEYARPVDLFARFMFEKDHKLSRVLAPGFFHDDGESKAFFHERYLSTCGSDPAGCLMRTDEASWLPDHFFTLSDRMSMASALEERVPLVDRELVALSRMLPRSYTLDLFRTKKVLKDAFRKELPDFLFKEPKRGWFSPAAKWLREPKFAAFAREVLSEGYYQGTKSLFKWGDVSLILERHLSKEEYNLTLLWALITFQTWAKRFKIEA